MSRDACRSARASALALLIAVACAAPARSGTNLAGTWAELQVLSEFATLPLVGEVQRTSAIVLRVTIEPSPTGFALRQTYCATEIDNGSAIASTAIPDAFLVSLGEVASGATLDASVSPARFEQPWTTEVRGAALEDPEHEPLPTQPDDPRVIDQDGDGKPGLTVRASALGILSGNVYVVQRVRTRLVGTLVSPNRIEGLIEWSTEQVTLGGTNPLFLGTLASRPDPETENSSFVLIRIDPAWTCVEILAHRATLFGALDPT